MNKKAVKKKWEPKIIKFFNEVVSKYQKKYCISDWIIILQFLEEPSTIDTEQSQILATTAADDVYHKAIIKFYPELLKDRDKKYSGAYVENCIKHELCHIITAKLCNLALDRHSTEKEINEEIESLTQKISIIS